MEHDFVCADGEIKTVTNEISKYITQLLKHISQYKKYLTQVQKYGIEDEVIRGKLGAFANDLNSYSNALNEILVDINSFKSEYLPSVETADKYDFPGDMNLVERLINSLRG